MKLRNLMFATMVACAFASCSKDEVIPEVDPTTKGDAELVISFETKDAKATKASSTADDPTVKNLYVYVYDTEGTYLAKGSTKGITDGIDNAKVTIKGLLVGTTIKCYAYANTGESEPFASSTPKFGDAVAVSIPTDKNGFVGSYLPMAGKSGEVELVAGQPTTGQTPTNTATVSLVRSVSRVDVVGLALNASLSKNISGITAAKFQLEGLSIEGVTITANTNGSVEAAEGAAYWGGYKGAHSTTDAKEFYKDAYMKSVVEQIDMKKKVLIENIADGTSLVSYYILPNANGKNTTLVLQGKFGYTTATTSVEPVTGYYPIVIAKDNAPEELKTNGKIEQNKAYKISITVAGLGKGDISGNEKAELVVKAEVKKYVDITQNVVVE